MIKKLAEKKKAIALRKQGKSYSEILAVIPVAKSTLSEWLHDVGLAKKQYQRLTEKKLQSAKRGGAAKRKQRIEKFNDIFSASRSEIGKISDRELFLIGVALYWAEGSKEKEYRPGSQLMFGNMDTMMINLFLVWLDRICKVKESDIGCEIYLHRTHIHRVDEIIKYWSKKTGFPVSKFVHIYFKGGVTSTTKRKNITDEKYFGLLRIKVKSSSDYVRKLAGWAQGIYDAVV